MSFIFVISNSHAYTRKNDSKDISKPYENTIYVFDICRNMIHL